MDPIKKNLAVEMLVMRLSDPEIDKCNALARALGLEPWAVLSKALELDFLHLSEDNKRAVRALCSALDAVSIGLDKHGSSLFAWNGNDEAAIVHVLRVVLGREVRLIAGDPRDADGYSGRPSSIEVGAEADSLAIPHSEFLRKVLELKTAELDALRVQLAKRTRTGDAI
jgi:hypothetical protein